MDTWIKICKHTPSKPKMHLIASRLNISRGDAFLNCFLLWAWADSLTVDGRMPGMTLASISELANVPIVFCEALSSDDIAWAVPYVVEKTGEFGVLLSGWQTHNGQCSRNRAMTNARKAKQRSGGKVIPKSTSRSKRDQHVTMK